MKRFFMVLAFFGLLMAGCNRNGDSAPSGLPPDEVRDIELKKVQFAVVDGKPLTAFDVKKTVEISVRLRKIASGKDMPAFGRWSNAQAMRITPSLVQARVLGHEINRLGITATAESDAAVLEKYNGILHRKLRSKDELFNLFDELNGPFAEQFQRESLAEAYYRTLPELKVTADDISRYYGSLSNRIVRCERINRRGRNLINEAWEKLKAGESWESVATNYTEDALLDETFADNWKDWMSLDIKNIEPPELALEVSKLEVGGYTPPVETEEGLVIVMLLSRDGTFCSLARILVRTAAPVDIPDREEAMKTLAAEKRVSWQKAALPKLREQIKVEFPLGHKFKYAIWPEAPRNPKGKPPAEIKK